MGNDDSVSIKKNTKLIIDLNKIFGLNISMSSAVDCFRKGINVNIHF